MSSRLAARLAATTAALAAVAAACAMAPPAGASAASEPTSTTAAAPAGETTAGELPGEDRERGWEKVVPGGDCMCADGSEFAFWERRANPTRVVLYLDGGGACADATSCAFTGEAGENDSYNWSLVGENPEAILGELWGVYGNMPGWEVNEGLTARDWGIPRFWTQAGLHDPDIVMARFDYAYDPNAARAVEAMGGDGSDLLALIDANEAAIEAAGVDVHSYTAPGAHHGILDLDVFYEVEVNGVRLVDWVRSLLEGRPLDDVHCERCEGP